MRELVTLFMGGKKLSPGRPRLCPDETARQVVRLKRSGLSLRRISAAMNEAGIKTPSGLDRWNHLIVRDLLPTEYVRELLGPWPSTGRSLEPG